MNNYSTLLPWCETDYTNEALNYDELVNLINTAGFDINSDGDVVNNYRVLLGGLERNFDIDAKFTTALKTKNITLIKLFKYSYVSKNNIPLYSLETYSINGTYTFTVVTGLTMFNYLTYCNSTTNYFRGYDELIDMTILNKLLEARGVTTLRELLGDIIIGDRLSTIVAVGLSLQNSSGVVIVVNTPSVYFETDPSNITFARSAYLHNQTKPNYSFPATVNGKSFISFESFSGDKLFNQGIYFDSTSQACLQESLSMYSIYKNVKNISIDTDPNSITDTGEPVFSYGDSYSPGDPITNPDASDFGQITFPAYDSCTSYTLGTIVYYLLNGQKDKITGLTDSTVDKNNNVIYCTNGTYVILASLDNETSESLPSTYNYINVADSNGNTYYKILEDKLKILNIPWLAKNYDNEIKTLPLALFGFGTGIFNLQQYLITNLTSSNTITSYGMGVPPVTIGFPGMNDSSILFQDSYVYTVCPYDGYTDYISTTKVYSSVLAGFEAHSLENYLFTINENTKSS